VEFTKGWRKLHNKELHDFYSSPNITGIIRSRMMVWNRHIARMEQKYIHDSGEKNLSLDNIRTLK
jgi:hypothetical protein